VIVRTFDGTQKKSWLSLEAYLAVMATTNFKQRTHKMNEYYHADRLNFAVAGTPNLLEYDQGFFVKQGGCMGDIKPITHLYMTQVYAQAKAFALPEEILSPPLLVEDIEPIKGAICAAVADRPRGWKKTQ
jgi:NAD+ synthase